MGQLERYGLYVLCLVIFLILGVAVWGDTDANAQVGNGRGGLGPGGIAAKIRGDQREPALKTKENAAGDLQSFLKRARQHTHAKQESARRFSEAGPNHTTPIDRRIDRRIDRIEPKPAVIDAKTKPVARRSHTVRDGETLGDISQRYLKDRHQWQRILAINPGVSERRLPIGTELKIPARRSAGKRSRRSSGKGKATTTYKLKDGESLWAVAARKWGRRKADDYVARIQKLNGISDPSAVRAGQVLKLPVD